MSVMTETSQSAMGPYFISAAATLASYSLTAVFSLALVVIISSRRRWVGGTGLLARSTGSHCGGHAAGWLASASLLATQGLVMSWGGVLVMVEGRGGGGGGHAASQPPSHDVSISSSAV
eukprot:scaffold98183_cov72-Phaeocystis_antarctica.AAC.2